ncbi:MAG: hypothetical protein ACC682_14085 [Gemmatimonadota bacterium]
MRGIKLREKALLAVICAVAGVSCVDGQSPPAGQTSGGASVLLADSTLARMLAEIQPAVERTSGMTATAPLNVAVTDEARLRAYLEAQLETQLSDEKAMALTAVYARLGLVPADIDLRELFTALLQEQVIGYYDPVSDTLFVHDRVPEADLAPVLAHELVHALQDQYVSLDSLSSSFGGRSDPVGAYQAAVEGHATYSMMEWQFGQMTGGEADLTAMPDLGPTLEAIDLAALGDFGSADVLAAAPAVIREGLMFPYIGGLLFLQRSWTRRPERPLPFGDELPESTEQILHVERWIDRDSPTFVEFVEPAGNGWEQVYSSDLGEFETRVFLREFLDVKDDADEAAAGWDGDAYRLLRRADDEVFVWVSVWDAREDAVEFASAAELAYAARYGEGERIVEVEIDHGESLEDGRVTVVIVDRPDGVEVPSALLAVELSGN